MDCKIVTGGIMESTSSKEKSKMEIGADTESDEEIEEVTCKLSGIRLLHFEHNYAKDLDMDPKEYQMSEVTVVDHVEHENIQAPVRRSQRHINKSEKDNLEKDTVATLQDTENTKHLQSSFKSKSCAEDESMLDIDVTDISKSPNINENKTPTKNKISKRNKSVNEDIDISKKMSFPKDQGKHSVVSKFLKKRKLSEEKRLLSEEKEGIQKRKTGEKNESNFPENELEKTNINTVHLNSRRKRAYSEPSKNDLNSLSGTKEEKETGKGRRIRNITKGKQVGTKVGSEEVNADYPSKKRKRNVSAPSHKVSIPANAQKNVESLNKGRRKKCLSLSEEASNDVVKTENKSVSVDNTKVVSKGTVSNLNTVTKNTKPKKIIRREAVRLVVNNDEPPLFSQPDVMVKVKSDDSSHKREEKGNTDEKTQGEILAINNDRNSSEESINTTVFLDVSDQCEKVEASYKNFNVPSRTSVASKDLMNKMDEFSHSHSSFTINDVCDFDTKDVDSENSLQIDESVGGIDDYKEESNEMNSNPPHENEVNFTTVSSNIKKSVAPQNVQEEIDITAKKQQDTSKEDKSSNEIEDSDKSIAERKPRRTIKKKEFFEDITARSLTQTKKSVAKQKATEKKTVEDSSKKGAKVTSSKSEDEMDSDESEDDPEKLWCICRKPHNDRFMIQCDSCEDWFHGSCVGVTRQLGRKLEKQQKEWICPNCLKKDENKSDLKPEVFLGHTLKKEETKVKTNENNQTTEKKDNVNESNNSLSRKIKPVDKLNKPPLQIKSSSDNQTTTAAVAPPPPSAAASKNVVTLPVNPVKKVITNTVYRTVTKEISTPSNSKKLVKEPAKKKLTCVTCHNPVSNSCYCSDKCVEKHAADFLAFLSEARGSSKALEESQKIAVMDRINGTVISGDNAPTVAEIVSWLKANPSFIISCATALVNSRKESSIQKKDTDVNSPVKERKESSDETSKVTVRLNVRKTLKNILMDRCKNADDIDLPEEEIRKIAVKIEEELNSLFKDNSFKYRAKYRSLMFNIKDPRNQGLFRKILKGNIPPDKLVRMSPEELASVELAKWREQENQHLLDMIKRVQLEQQTSSGLLLKKTHKGEVEIEDDFTSIIDQDIPKHAPKVLLSESIEGEKSEEKEVVKDTTHHHRSHLFDLNCKICTGKILPPPVEESTPKKVRVAHSISVDQSSALDATEKNVAKIVDAKSPLSSTGDDSLDQEPTSTVSIGSPDASLRFSFENEPSSKVTSSVWKGFIYMQDVAKFVTSAYKVSGQTEYLHMDVPDTIQVCGRIIPDQVFDYLGKIKQSGNKELIIVRFQAANDEEAITYNSFYSYLSSRKRYGVVSSYSKKIKDFYILPLAATSPVPIVLMPFDGPGLPSPRPHLLLGVIVRHKVKQIISPIAKKEKSRDDVERLDGSYTPPLDTRSYTPPLPTLQCDNDVNITQDSVYSPSLDLKSTTSSEESDITQTSGSSVDIKKTESDIYEPSYTPPLQILPSNSPKETDEDKPYDPEQDVVTLDTTRKSNKLNSDENVGKSATSTENLEKHKKILDALTRQVEETDRQVNALKQLISQPDDSDVEYNSPSTQTLDINSVTASGMSSFLDLPENLQDILNVVREKSLDKEKETNSKGDVDMRINSLFGKPFNNTINKFGPAFQSSNDSNNMSSKDQEKDISCETTSVDDDESLPAVVRPSDPRIKLRTSFPEVSTSLEEPANVSLSNMSVSELVERAEKELANMESSEHTDPSKQNISSNQEKITPNLKLSSSWNQFKEPPPPGIEPSDITPQDNAFTSKSSSTSVADNSLPPTFASAIIPDPQQINPHFPPPSLPSSFSPHLPPPGFSIQTPPPNIKNFPPPSVISTSFPPPPLPIVSKGNDVSPVNETWPSWPVPSQQSKDNSWQNRVPPQWDENWKHSSENAPAEGAESSSHYFPTSSHDFHYEPFYKDDISSEGRQSRPNQRFFRNNWNKCPTRGSLVRGNHWRGRRAFPFNKS